jgi:hypothetical protein
VFEVVDTNCEAAVESNLPPRISMSTVSRTAIRTKRGWPKWTGYDGTLYKRCDFSGEFTQTAFPSFNFCFPDGEQCAGARYEFAGFDEIDADGRHISQHTKHRFVECTNTAPTLNQLVGSSGGVTPVVNFRVPVLLGYCWEPDSLSCATCNHDGTTWSDVGDVGHFGVSDFDQLMFPGNLSSTALVETVTGGTSSCANNFFLNPPREDFPEGSVFGTLSFIVQPIVLVTDGSWSKTLSEEYTDGDVNSSAIRYTSNAPVAENYPNYNQFTLDTFLNISSRATVVTYILNCINLAIGRDYIASVQYRDSSGAVITVPTTFTAESRTQAIVANIPTPAPGHNIRVQNPRIRFAPIT